MQRALFLFASGWLAFGCSNGLDAQNLDDDRRPPADTDAAVDTDVVDDTDVEDTDVVDTDVPETDEDGDGWLGSDGDCDDADASVYPGAEELCDGRDNDCDGDSDADHDDDADGARDCDDACPIYVDETAVSGRQNGTFADPFVWIQDAIDAAAGLGCSTIRVRPGLYEESIDFLGQDLDVASTDGPTLTTIRGDGLGSVVTFALAETDAAILEGFTITEGGGITGAGIYAAGADPVVRNNVITGNDAGSGGGGGVYLVNSSAWIVDNTIDANVAGVGGPEEGCDGGGIFVRSGAPVIEGNTITSNLAGDGGGLWLAYADALITGNLIAGNEARDTDAVKGGQGGGVNLQIGTVDFYMSGNIVVENSASTHGGGVAIYEYHSSYGDPYVANNTIAFNEVTSTTYGAGLVGWSLTRGTVLNNIVYGNRGPGVWLNTTTSFEYNDVYGNSTDYAGNQGTLTGTAGNLSIDPQFTAVSDDGDWTNDDWTLKSTSPLRGAGDPDVRNRDGSRSHLGATGGPYGF